MENPAKSREEKISELQGKIKAVDGRISANSREIEGAEERLKETRRYLELIGPLESEAREKRQGLLADGKENKEATKTLHDIREKRELSEDQIVGLEKKLLNLKAEGESLPGEKRNHEMDLRGLMLIPLISKYNEIAGKMARILEEIYGIVWQLDYPLHFVYPSSSLWEGSLELIPRLYFTPEHHPGVSGEHLFRKSDYFERYKKVQQEIEGK